MNRWLQCDVLAEEVRKAGFAIRLHRKEHGVTTVFLGETLLTLTLDAGELWAWLQGVLCGLELLRKLYQDREP